MDLCQAEHVAYLGKIREDEPSVSQAREVVVLSQRLDQRKTSEEAADVRHEALQLRAFRVVEVLIHPPFELQRTRSELQTEFKCCSKIMFVPPTLLLYKPFQRLRGGCLSDAS